MPKRPAYYADLAAGVTDKGEGVSEGRDRLYRSSPHLIKK